MVLLREISDHDHAVCDFPLEEGDLFLDAEPDGALPLSIVLLFLLIMSHFFCAITVLCNSFLNKKYKHHTSIKSTNTYIIYYNIAIASIAAYLNGDQPFDPFNS